MHFMFIVHASLNSHLHYLQQPAGAPAAGVESPGHLGETQGLNTYNPDGFWAGAMNYGDT